MAFLNKAVLSVYKFDHSATILLLQLVFTVVLLNVLKALGLLPFEDFSIADAKRVRFS